MIQQSQKNNWQTKKLCEVCDISAGGTPFTRKHEYWNGNIPWMNSGDLNKRIIFDVEGRITEKGLNSSSAKLVPVNSVLIGLAGQGKTRGTVAINKIELATNQSVAFFMPKEINYKFLYFNLYKRYEELRQISAGDGGRGGLNLQLLKNLKILLPPILEQNRIVAILEIWDKYLEKLSRKIEIKKDVKKGLMQRLLSGGVRLSGFSGEWENVKLGDLGNTYQGITGKSKDDFGKGKPFISYMNIYSNSKLNIQINNFVDIRDGEKQNKVKYGDLFFTTSSETPNEVGISSVLLDKNIKDLYLNSFCFGFRLHNFKTLIPEFAQFYFRSQNFRKQMTRIAQGASRFNLSKKYFLETKIEISKDIKEQTAIAEILTTADKEIETLEKKKKIIEEQKRFLLNNLVTGGIIVNC